MDVIQVQDQFYILATSSRIAESNRVLKHDDTFAVFDQFGAMHRYGLGEQGLFYDGTRFLSRFDVRLLGRRPLLLNSTVKDDNAVFTADLTNADVSSNGDIELPRDSLHIFESCLVLDGVCYFMVRVRSFLLRPVRISMTIQFDADFADIFEVRGMKRAKRGQMLPATCAGGRVQLGYRGLDDRVRRTNVSFTPEPESLDATRAEYQRTIEPRGDMKFVTTVQCITDAAAAPPVLPFDEALTRASELRTQLKADEAQVTTSNEQFNDWLNRSTADLHLMLTATPHGFYPYAGIPWYSTIFGRDGIITALEYLWVNPMLAAGVLKLLAAMQAQEFDADCDAEPGKILHEARGGEMAATGEIPFGRYYGSVDSTPLFVVLAGAYYERTGDLMLIRELWPSIQAALKWIDEYGDVDGDGFVEFSRRSDDGLVMQGWKDSVDSVFHADGSAVEGPVALCEVQGYAYAARRAAARLAAVLGQEELASDLLKQAESFRLSFEKTFWCDDIQMYVLALDGKKRPCAVRTSNAGHCLLAGIASPERARMVASRLLEEPFYSGWGIRTVARSESRFNPMSYHNGSVWPHDNAMCAAGFARYGLREQALRVFNGLFDASLFVDLRRMPELFCGFPRRAGVGPTPYPVACAPQSWAAVSVFSLLSSILGMNISAPERLIKFRRAILPESVQRLRISNLRVGDAVLDLSLERFRNNVAFEIVRRQGDIEVVVVK